MLRDIFGAARVIPVLTVEEVEAGVALCRALHAGGLTVLEITLRTPAALDAVTAVKEALPDATVGVGTVLTPAQLDAAAGRGAAFAVSPGLTEPLIAAARGVTTPLLPGAQTVSEVMRARDAGFELLKFFPAEPSGGVATLKAYAPLFGDLAFCPTGGLNAVNAPEYLSLKNVLCVGGTWMMPPRMLELADWAGIEAAARAARALG